MHVQAHLSPRQANHQPLTPLDFLDRTLAVHSDRTAVIWRDRRWSYADFGEIVARMAAFLRLRLRLAVASGSAVLTGLAAALLFQLALGLTGSATGALVAALGFALGSPVWGWSTTVFAALPNWPSAPSATRSRRCLRARRTSIMPMSRSTPGQGAPRARTGPRCCCAFTPSGANGTALRSS